MTERDLRRRVVITGMGALPTRAYWQVEWERGDTSGIGVLLGNGNGGFPNTEEAGRTLVEKGGMRMDPFYVAKMLPNMAASQVAIQFGLGGYNNTAITACAAPTQARGEGLAGM